MLSKPMMAWYLSPAGGCLRGLVLAAWLVHLGACGVEAPTSDGPAVSLAGRGDAPGEFWRIAHPLVGPVDTIFVHDYRQGRLTVLSPRLEFVRVITNVLYPPDLVLIDGTFVLGRQIPTAERWDPATGERLARVDVSSAWFVGAPGPHEDPFQPPDPIIEAVTEDHRGLLWVLLRDAAADWQPPHPSEVNWEQPVTPESYDAAHDWVLEVVDPETAAVIASHRFESAPWLNPRSMLLATLRPYWVDPDPEAHVTFDVWRLDLVAKEEHR